MEADEEKGPEIPDLDKTTLMDSCNDRQKMIYQLREAASESSRYFSARTNEAFWKAIRMAEDELADLLDEIQSINQMMLGRQD